MGTSHLGLGVDIALKGKSMEEKRVLSLNLHIMIGTPAPERDHN